MPRHEASGHGKGTKTWHMHEGLAGGFTRVQLIVSKKRAWGFAADAVPSFPPRLVEPVSFATIPMLAT